MKDNIHTITISTIKGNVTVTDNNGRSITRKNLKSGLNALIESYYEDEKKNGIMGALRVGQPVKILPPKGTRIIGYDGKPEGFPDEYIGKIGVIESFDKSTRSCKTTLVRIDDTLHWGSHEQLTTKIEAS